MTEAVLDWAAIFASIQTELAGVLNTAGEPAFGEGVIQGEPMGLPLGGPYVCFWYLGRQLSTKTQGAPATLGNVMYAARVQIMCLWPIQPERVSLGGWEQDIAAIDTSIRRAFRGNSTINSEVTDLDITDSSVTYGDLPLGGGKFGLYRVLQFELRLDNLEGEPING